MNGTLFDVVTVHCFWGWCKHTMQDIDPYAASRMMEQHYEAAHYGKDLE